MKYSIVIPMFNEEDWVENVHNTLSKFIAENNLDAQLIFATDGCTDNTVNIIKKIQNKYPELINYNHPEKLGRGRALSYVIKNVDTPYVIYMDSDLATDLKYLLVLMNELENGADIVTGSRLMKGSICKRRKKRDFVSKIYNKLCRILFNSKIYDHQCGFKGFRRDSILPWIDEVKNTHWSWDTEILIRGQRKGLIIKEIPIAWADPRTDKQSKVRIWHDAKEMGKNLIKLRYDLFSETMQQLIKYLMVGIANTLITFLTLFIFDLLLIRGNWSYPIAYICGMINGYLMNKFFTFKKKEFTKKTPLEMFLFVCVEVFGIWYYSMISIFFESKFNLIWPSFNFNYLLAAMIATIINFLTRFPLTKFIVFRSKKK